ncbi:hypothetical protein TEA_012064 [Camellia sinensis var. sinensis]|uniref:Amino acid transporter transmembrane domain-containing protein n=1 Tax=Camellia sinensis var. sinensis TaxID=542762 RepID=A0A4S4D2Y6_CAMSN|nr:hypothetical protein TEA_012064 [Camellia sinensis var. sinensis]
MARETQNKSMFIEQAQESLENADTGKNFDDDGRPKRTGSVVTASAHIITAVIGSGVLSLAWAIAQLGWVAGPAVLMAFSFITYFTSTLLADCYRSPDPVTGTRNYTYMDVVEISNINGFGSFVFFSGGIQVKLCGIAQYGNLIGVTIGYTITASISMVAVNRSNCFHKYGHHVKCSTSNYPFMIIFAIIQIILSQIPNFHKLSWLSILAAVMSFAYSSIGVGLSIAKVAGGAHARTSLTGVTVGVDVSASEKVWRSFQAIGDIAFAYAYSTVLIEIQASSSFSFCIYLQHIMDLGCFYCSSREGCKRQQSRLGSVVQFSLILGEWQLTSAFPSIEGQEQLTKLLIGWPKPLSTAAFLFIGLPTLQ